MSKLVNSPELAPPIGFAHALKTVHTVYLACQTALDRQGEIVGATMVQQFDQAAANLMAALKAAGGEPDDLASLQIFVTSVGEYKEALSDLGAIWRKHFGRRYPAMGLFGISELFDPAAKVELMGVAVISPPA